MRTRKYRVRPASAASQPSAEWQRFGTAWADIAYSAIGSRLLADLVGGAAACLGIIVENELRAKAETAARARTKPQTTTGDGQPSDDAQGVGSASVGDAHDQRTADAEAAPPPPPPPPPIDPRAADAASALGISVDASEDEIRAALRAALSSSRLHPDHGGDGDEAKTLIAAKNYLVERARAART